MNPENNNSGTTCG